jgi:hypothetical protein
VCSEEVRRRQWARQDPEPTMTSRTVLEQESLEFLLAQLVEVVRKVLLRFSTMSADTCDRRTRCHLQGHNPILASEGFHSPYGR